jgi:hypothetical protein
MDLKDSAVCAGRSTCDLKDSAVCAERSISVEQFNVKQFSPV